MALSSQVNIINEEARGFLCNEPPPVSLSQEKIRIFRALHFTLVISHPA